MPVSGRTPTRIHLEDSPSTKWTAGAAYPDPNDSTKLVRDVDARVTGEVDVTASTSVTIDADSNPVIAMDDDSPAGAISVSLDSSVEDGFIRDVFNESANTATLTPTSGDINDGTGAASSKVLVAGASCRLVKSSSGSPATAHWRVLKGAGGVSAFTDLIDAPSSYSGQAGLVPVVNPTEDGLVFSGIGTIALPDWLSYSPDAPPSSPSVYDDEFVGASLDAKWAWVNQGTSTATVGSGALLLDCPGLTGSNFHGLGQSAPAAPWKIRVKIADILDFGTNFWGVGIYVRNSSSGKIVSLGITRNSGIKFGIENWNSATSYNAAVSLTAAVQATGTWYLEIENDGTNLYFRWCVGGLKFFQLGSVAISAFISSINQFGVYAQTNSVNEVCGHFDWFRVL